MLSRIIKSELNIMLEITDNIYTCMPIPDNKQKSSDNTRHEEKQVA